MIVWNVTNASAELAKYIGVTTNDDRFTEKQLGCRLNLSRKSLQTLTNCAEWET